MFNGGNDLLGPSGARRCATAPGPARRFGESFYGPTITRLPVKEKSFYGPTSLFTPPSRLSVARRPFQNMYLRIIPVHLCHGRKLVHASRNALLTSRLECLYKLPVSRPENVQRLKRLTDAVTFWILNVLSLCEKCPQIERLHNPVKCFCSLQVSIFGRFLYGLFGSFSWTTSSGLSILENWPLIVCASVLNNQQSTDSIPTSMKFFCKFPT